LLALDSPLLEDYLLKFAPLSRAHASDLILVDLSDSHLFLDALLAQSNGLTHLEEHLFLLRGVLA